MKNDKNEFVHLQYSSVMMQQSQSVLFCITLFLRMLLYRHCTKRVIYHVCHNSVASKLPWHHDIPSSKLNRLKTIYLMSTGMKLRINFLTLWTFCSFAPTVPSWLIDRMSLIAVRFSTFSMRTSHSDKIWQCTSFSHRFPSTIVTLKCSDERGAILQRCR